MTAAAFEVQHPTGLAFDSLAERYDDLFTRSLIGRAQRSAVWEVMVEAFEPGGRILELNCGTGEDALFLDGLDISVVACDASAQMIQRARRRMSEEAPDADIEFLHLPTERLAELAAGGRFDGAFSNFSGLNCVADLGAAARDIASLVAPRSPVVICLSSRFCLLEMLWFVLHGNFRKAFRRTSGHAVATVGGFVVKVHYPTLRAVKALFAPSFRLVSCTGIGVAVPPSYVEETMHRHPRLLQLLISIDQRIARWPLLRTLGDHVLLHFERRGL